MGVRDATFSSFKFVQVCFLVYSVHMSVHRGRKSGDWEDSANGVMHDTISVANLPCALLRACGNTCYMRVGASLLNAFSVDSSKILLISFLAFFTMSGEVPSIKR